MSSSNFNGFSGNNNKNIINNNIVVNNNLIYQGMVNGNVINNNKPNYVPFSPLGVINNKPMYNNNNNNNCNVLFSPQLDLVRNKLLTSILSQNNMNMNIKKTPNKKATSKFSSPNITLDDPQYRIMLEQVIIYLTQIIRRKDKRTTIMIRHIPNKYTMTAMLEEIDKDFKGKYDLFYLPLDYNNNCNLGFAFINFVDPMHIVYFYDMFRGNRWQRFNSDKVRILFKKICELVYAKFQGKKDLIAHFEKGNVLNFDSDEKKPLILNTPDELPIIELPLVNIFFT
jgi:hypothetical protein